MVTNTSTYHIAYTVAAVIYATYVFSLWTRAKRARDRVDELERSPR